MPELPKPAREGLRRSQGGSVTAHPDADLLTAFAEQSLPSREREQVMQHLSVCPDCREVLAMSAPEAPLAGVSPEPSRSWLSGRMLRWVSLAAAAVVVAAVGLSFQTLRSRSASYPVNGRVAAAPEADKDTLAHKNDQIEAAPAANAPGSKPASPPNPATREEAGERDRLKLAEPRNAPAEKTKIAALESAGVAAKKQEPFNFKTAPGIPPQVSASKVAVSTEPTERLEDKDAKQAAATSHYSLPSPAPPPARAGTVLGTQQQAAASQVEQSQSQNQLRQTVVPSGTPRDDAQVQSRTASSGASQNQVFDQTQASPGSNQTVDVTAAAGAAQVNTETVQVAPAQRALRKEIRDVIWAVSNKGAVQMSRDGQSWRNVKIDRNATFRALAADKQNVWVGGNGGVLYHSVDAGAHWTRVTPAVDGVSLSQDVVHIDLADEQHVSLNTAAHEVWSTADGGQTWTRK